MIDSSNQVLRQALLPFASRLPGMVREQEILRIAGKIGDPSQSDQSEAARKHVLAWVQYRSGGRLPGEAWKGESFEYMSGGRNSQGIRFNDKEADIWTVRAEDPDKTVPGRVWITEIVIAGTTQQPRPCGRI